MMTITGTNMERETRERLGVALARLAAIKPNDLMRPMHSKMSFRNGRSDFERTLSISQKVACTDLRQVPSEYLKIVADDACETLARFHEIQSFTGDGIENPEQVRAALIAAVHDAYPPINEDLSLIIKAPPARLEQVRTARNGAILAMIMEIAVLAAVIAAITTRYTACLRTRS
jgi:hypothetical protein